MRQMLLELRMRDGRGDRHRRVRVFGAALLAATVLLGAGCASRTGTVPPADVGTAASGDEAPLDPAIKPLTVEQEEDAERAAQ